MQTAFVQWAARVSSVSLDKGNAEIYRKSGLVISHEQGLRYEAELSSSMRCQCCRGRLALSGSVFR